MATELQVGSATTDLTIADLHNHLAKLLEQYGELNRVLLLPPDFTRKYSGAGEVTQVLIELLGKQVEIDAMPALGTHVPMTSREIATMYGHRLPAKHWLEHNWREDLRRVGEVPAELIKDWSGGAVDYAMPIEVNKRLWEGEYDLIISIGQIVPHEVIGMANYTKNVCVGVGGQETINKSHFLGAAYGMERIMGQTDTPVRRALDYGVHEFMGDLPLLFVLTVMEKDHDANRMIFRGLFGGTSKDMYAAACDLSRECNLNLLEKPIKKAVVYLEPDEFHTTWLGNKAVYRTRLAMADDGELLILAPGLRGFGEDAEIDRLIRKYGYCGTPATLAAVAEHEELRNNLSAAAHLIHGSSEGRFKITYCPGDGVSEAEVRSVGFDYRPYHEVANVYDPARLRDGWQTIAGEEIFYVSNPGLGLWAHADRFR